MIENYVKSDYSETWLENGIIIQHINPKINEIDILAAKQLIADRKNATGQAIKKSLVLVIVNNAVNVNKEAKKYYEEEDPYVNIIAIAMVMDNFIASVMANLVFKLKKNPLPIEFFNNKVKALKWLEKYKMLINQN